MTTCFAIKTAVQCGLWNNGKSTKKGSIKFIKIFKIKSGYFVDPWLTKSCKIGIRSYETCFFYKITEKFKENPYL